MRRNAHLAMAAAHALGLGGLDPFTELDRRLYPRRGNPYPKGKIQPVVPTQADLDRIAAAQAKRARKAAKRNKLNGLKTTQIIVDEVK